MRRLPLLAVKAELGRRRSGDLGRHGAGDSATDSQNHRVVEVTGADEQQPVEPLTVPVAAAGV